MNEMEWREVYQAMTAKELQKIIVQEDRPEGFWKLRKSQLVDLAVEIMMRDKVESEDEDVREVYDDKDNHDKLDLTIVREGFVIQDAESGINSYDWREAKFRPEPSYTILPLSNGRVRKYKQGMEVNLDYPIALIRRDVARNDIPEELVLDDIVALFNNFNEACKFAKDRMITYNAWVARSLHEGITVEMGLKPGVKLNPGTMYTPSRFENREGYINRHYQFVYIRKINK